MAEEQKKANQKKVEEEDGRKIGKYREKLYGTGAYQGSECTMTLSALLGTPPPSGQIKGKPQGYKPQPSQAKPAARQPANPYIAAPTAELAIETTY